MSVGSRVVKHVRFEPETKRALSDSVVVEEPLEVRLDGRSVAVTMRTPGHDAELALGFLVTEGVVRNTDAVLAVAACPDDPNVVEVRTAPGARGIEPPAVRHFYATSSCGICGKASIDAIRVRTETLAGVETRVMRSVLQSLPARMRPAQGLFSETGALHAAGLFEVTGTPLCIREDVGRHNAVDKVIGWAAVRERLPLHETVLLVSGRASFEIVQKAAVAGIPIVAAISGPSSLSVELAREAGMTLIAFLRDQGMNVYGGEERIQAE